VKPLAGLKVLDLSQRLPGPLAGMLLADLGAEVVKIEDSTFRDAFLEQGLSHFDDSFVEWYGELNGKKRLMRVDFKAAETPKLIQNEIENCDIILHGLPIKIAGPLGLSIEQLKQHSRGMAVLELGASQQHKSAMHDLNALAEAGFLNLHVAGQTQSPLAPPFLPVAGISFGQQIALTALALHRQAQQDGKPAISKVFLYDEIVKVYRPFWTQKLREQNRTKFLHNGIYPCYALYRNKDGDWLAVAAVEEKFWRKFIELLKINIQESDRFSTNPEIFRSVAQSIKALSTAELEGLLKNKDICVSLIRLNP